MSTFIVSCQDCGQETAWMVAELASSELFRDLAKEKAKGRIISLDTGDKYQIGVKPMWGSRDCKTCGSVAKTPELFATIEQGAQTHANT